MKRTGVHEAESASTVRLRMLAGLKPSLRPGVFVYCQWPEGLDVPLGTVVATFREDEGLTAVINESHAKRLRLVPKFRGRWISLGLESALDGVGLTSEVVAALADAGIVCNVIAALHHHHLFVPVRQAAPALLRLQAVMRAAQVIDQEPHMICGIAKRG